MAMYKRMVDYYLKFMNAFLRMFVYDWLPANHYAVHVEYDLLSSDVILQRRLLFFWQEVQRKGITYQQPRPVCTPGEKVFYLHTCGPQSYWELHAWGGWQRSITAPNGYRLATHEELLAFSKAHPEIGAYMGIGSYVKTADCRTVLAVGEDKRVYFADIYERVYAPYNLKRILFVARQRF